MKSYLIKNIIESVGSILVEPIEEGKTRDWIDYCCKAKSSVFINFLFLSTNVFSSSYECVVTRKLDSENIYPKSQLVQYKYSVRIEDEKNPKVDRCSFTPSEKKVTCDKYSVDRVEVDKNVGIKKFYYFKGQFDVQLYPDLRFVENNGRGGISYGKCEKLRSASPTSAQ